MQRLIAAIMVAVVGVGCSDWPGSSVWEPFPPPGPVPPLPEWDVAFESTRDGAPAIYAVHADGSGVSRIVDGSAPAVSATGALAFHRTSARGATRIFVRHGQGERFVAEGSDPHWSPDATRIVFHANGSIYTRQAFGSGAAYRVLAADATLPAPPWHAAGDWQPIALVAPRWSPDGTRIAFTAIVSTTLPRDDGDPMPSKQLHVYTVDADGSNPVLVTGWCAPRAGEGTPYCSTTSPAWTPDGERLTVVATPLDADMRIAGHPSIVSVGPDGWDGRQVLHVGDRADISSLSWSADGEQLLFTQPGATTGKDMMFPRIFRLHVRSGDTALLVPEASNAPWSYFDSRPAWRWRTPGSGEGEWDY
jgi:dipeptidyl aminopeptidase/acylaminoacyl peptidase